MTLEPPRRVVSHENPGYASQEEMVAASQRTNHLGMNLSNSTPVRATYAVVQKHPTVASDDDVTMVDNVLYTRNAGVCSSEIYLHFRPW